MYASLHDSPRAKLPSLSIISHTEHRGYSNACIKTQRTTARLGMSSLRRAGGQKHKHTGVTRPARQRGASLLLSALGLSTRRQATVLARGCTGPAAEGHVGGAHQGCSAASGIRRTARPTALIAGARCHRTGKASKVRAASTGQEHACSRRANEGAQHPHTEQAPTALARSCQPATKAAAGRAEKPGACRRPKGASSLGTQHLDAGDGLLLGAGLAHNAGLQGGHST